MVVACWIDIDSQTLSALDVDITRDAAQARLVSRPDEPDPATSIEPVYAAAADAPRQVVAGR
jgi:hypothetical protein